MYHVVGGALNSRRLTQRKHLLRSRPFQRLLRWSSVEKPRSFLSQALQINRDYPHSFVFLLAILQPRQSHQNLTYEKRSISTLWLLACSALGASFSLSPLNTRVYQGLTPQLVKNKFCISKIESCPKAASVRDHGCCSLHRNSCGDQRR